MFVPSNNLNLDDIYWHILIIPPAQNDPHGVFEVRTRITDALQLEEPYMYSLRSTTYIPPALELDNQAICNRSFFIKDYDTAFQFAHTLHESLERIVLTVKAKRWQSPYREQSMQTLIRTCVDASLNHARKIPGVCESYESLIPLPEPELLPESGSSPETNITVSVEDSEEDIDKPTLTRRVPCPRHFVPSLEHDMVWSVTDPVKKSDAYEIKAQLLVNAADNKQFSLPKDYSLYQSIRLRTKTEEAAQTFKETLENGLEVAIEKNRQEANNQGKPTTLFVRKAIHDSVASAFKEVHKRNHPDTIDTLDSKPLALLEQHTLVVNYSREEEIWRFLRRMFFDPHTSKTTRTHLEQFTDTRDPELRRYYAYLEQIFEGSHPNELAQYNPSHWEPLNEESLGLHGR